MKTTTSTSMLIRVLILVSVIMSSTILKSFGQQHPSFTQYMFNSLALNPAYAGYSGGGESVEITALAREQWMGIEGAPSTRTLSAHAPVPKTNMGLGVQLFHDQIGASNEVGSYFSYAYHIPLSKKRFDGKRFRDGHTLSLGVQAGVSYFQNNLSSLRVNVQGDGQDTRFMTNDNEQVFFNVGAGAFYYSEKFYVGLSVPYILNNSYGNESRQSRHIFLTGGYLFDLTPSLQLKPSTLIKAVSGAPIQADINANLIIKKALWVGASWRSFASVSVMAEYQVTPRIRIGYAYDMATNGLQEVGGNAHEFRLNYRIPLGDIKILNPRCF